MPFESLRTVARHAEELRELNKSVVVGTEIRLIEDTAGCYWSNHRAFSASTLEDYRGLGDLVVVVARTAAGPWTPSLHRVSMPWIRVVPLRNYRGVGGLLTNLPHLILALFRVVSSRSLCVGRLPEPVSILLYLIATARRRPFVAFIVADPAQVGKQTVGARAQKLSSAVLTGIVRSATRRSAGLIYVTRSHLQSLYPPRRTIPTLARSNVLLTEDSFRVRESYEIPTRGARLISIGSMGSLAKGHDALLDALARLRESCINIHLTIIGGGSFECHLRQKAADLEIGDAVTFLGHVSDHREILRHLDASDAYVSGSRMEGLPRAVIEAMARSLPVVATAAGGTAELISHQALVPVDDISTLTERINRLIQSEQLRRELGVENYKTARTYEELASPGVLQTFLKGLPF